MLLHELNTSQSINDSEHGSWCFWSGKIQLPMWHLKSQSVLINCKEMPCKPELLKFMPFPPPCYLPNTSGQLTVLDCLYENHTQHRALSAAFERAFFLFNVSFAWTSWRYFLSITQQSISTPHPLLHQWKHIDTSSPSFTLSGKYAEFECLWGLLP